MRYIQWIMIFIHSWLELHCQIQWNIPISSSCNLHNLMSKLHNQHSANRSIDGQRSNHRIKWCICGNLLCIWWSNFVYYWIKWRWSRRYCICIMGVDESYSMIGVVWLYWWPDAECLCVTALKSIAAACVSIGCWSGYN